MPVRLIRLLFLCIPGVLCGGRAAAQVAPSAIPTPLTYENAVAFATSRNLGIEAARRQRAIREAAVRTARQSPNPDLSVELSRDTPHHVLTVDVPLELGGRRGRRIDLASQELTLADVDLQAELRTVRRELRQAFYSLIAADERVRLAETVADIARRVRDAAQARFDTGAAPRLEVLQADLGVTRAETDLGLARSVRRSVQSTLNGVLNLPPDRALVVAGSLSDRRSGVDYEQALTLALASNTNLVSFDRQIAVEQRRLDLLRAERVPTPVFSFSGLFNNPPDFTVGPRAAIGIGLPLFSRNQGEIAASIATTAQLRTARDQTRRVVENELFGTVARIDAERRQVEAYEQRLLPAATDLEALAEESYRAGRTSVLGVFEAERSLRDIRSEALQAALDLQMSLADLEELLGTPLP